MEDNTGDRTVEQPIGTRTRVPPEELTEEPEEPPIATRTRVPRR